VGLVLIELGARVVLPNDLDRPITRLSNLEGQPIAELDDEMGFAMLAPGPWYSKFGTQPNTYSLKRDPSHLRVVFLGDSVTYRGRIVRGLQALFPDPRIEWWNAGVESFNTRQEVIWYRRYVRTTKPDLVVLTVHPNDLDGTAVMFIDRQGNLTCYREGRPPVVVNTWLYFNSRIYRLFTGISDSGEVRQGTRQEMAAALSSLREMLAADGTDLFLFLMPWTKPHESWNSWELGRYDIVRSIVQDVGVPWCDGLAELEAATAAGETISKRPGDSWHPSHELARRFAQRMRDSGVFASLVRRQPSLQGAPIDATNGH
jgi:hypothetical protein